VPELDGFGVIDAVGVESMPHVVFVTAFDEYALKAFGSERWTMLAVHPERFAAVIARERGSRARRAMTPRR
jgi:two-component system LytT family response regulator